MKIRSLLIPVVALAGVLGVGSYAAADVPVTRNINVGGGGDGVAALDFFPDAVTIHKGDAIHFANPYEEPHTTTYVPTGMEVPGSRIPNPSGAGLTINPRFYEPTGAPGKATDVDPLRYYNSGVMSKGNSVDVIFSAVGSYKMICLFHPGMELAVDVTGASVTIASQADLDKQGAAQRDAFIASGKAIIAAAQQTKVTDAAGASTWNLQAGADPAQTEVMRFLPDRPLNISTGDTVKWATNVFAPHTVTFGDSPEAARAGGSTYNGGNANSGVMWAPGGRDTAGRDLPAAPGGKTYILTFTRAGTYTYVCLLHANQGMTGTIDVTDKAPAQPSQTSTDSSGHRTAYALAGTAAAVLAIVVAGVWAMRRQRRIS
jgi:plastocyanin